MLCLLFRRVLPEGGVGDCATGDLLKGLVRVVLTPLRTTLLGHRVAGRSLAKQVVIVRGQVAAFVALVAEELPRMPMVRPVRLTEEDHPRCGRALALDDEFEAVDGIAAADPVKARSEVPFSFQ